MKFDVITIFPEIFDFYLKHSILKKAQDKGAIKIKIHNLRDFTTDKHKTVDDKSFGGGRGMVIKVGPIYRCVRQIVGKRTKTYHLKPKTLIILFTPRGKKFNQKMATGLAKLDRLILISGRYEGIDERAAKYIADEKISIGDYVLMGGDLPALVLIESVARLVPGVIGKSELLGERITKKKGFIEYPQYTRPEVFAVPAEARKAKAGAKKGACWKVPKVLLSGNHKKIKEWRAKHSKIISS